MIDFITNINNALNSFIWGVPAMTCIIGVGLYLAIRTGFLQIRKFGYALKNTVGRMFQKQEAADGSLTPAGRSRYADDVREKKAVYKAANKEYRKSISKAQRGSIAGISPTKKHRQVGAANWADAEKKANKANKAEREYKDAKKAYKNTDEYKAKQKDRAKKAAVVGAAVVGTALAAYGAYKVNQYVKDSHVKLQAKRGHD